MESMETNKGGRFVVGTAVKGIRAGRNGEGNVFSPSRPWKPVRKYEAKVRTRENRELLVWYHKAHFYTLSSEPK